MYKRTLLIDLDGVLNQYGKEKYNKSQIPKIKDGAREFIEQLYYSNKYELILFTTRNIFITTKWLIKNNLDTYFEDVTNIKIPAFLCIDDRAICFKGNYTQTLEEIKNFQTWWK